MSRLSVVIPTMGNYDVLGRTLDGYAAQAATMDEFEVVVVVDAADPEPEMVDRVTASRPFEIRCLRGAVPGASANRNIGWRAAQSELVLFTDNDTIPTPRLVTEHLAWHERHPDSVTGVLGAVRWAPELEVTTFMRWLDRGMQFDLQSVEGIDAGWGRFVTANVSVKRAFVERVGDFDEEHFPYGYEDTDWAYRASKLGFVLLYNRAALVDHLRAMDLEFWKKRARRVAVAERTFTRLHPDCPPWFHRLFTEAMSEPEPRGRALRLAPFVPEWTPWLGRRLWEVVDIHYRRQLAPHFLEAWNEAASLGVAAAQPDLSEYDPEASTAGPK